METFFFVIVTFLLSNVARHTISDFVFLYIFKEIERAQMELNENKQRLELALQDAASTKDEYLKLIEQLGKTEQQLHLTR